MHGHEFRKRVSVTDNFLIVLNEVLVKAPMDVTNATNVSIVVYESAPV